MGKAHWLTDRWNVAVWCTQTAPLQFHCIRDGDALGIGEREWSALTAFGHSPEQAILHSAEGDILISGDQGPRAEGSAILFEDGCEHHRLGASAHA